MGLTPLESNFPPVDCEPALWFADLTHCSWLSYATLCRQLLNKAQNHLQ